jgi:hypothetical protein
VRTFRSYDSFRNYFFNLNLIRKEFPQANFLNLLFLRKASIKQIKLKIIKDKKFLKIDKIELVAGIKNHLRSALNTIFSVQDKEGYFRNISVDNEIIILFLFILYYTNNHVSSEILNLLEERIF